MPGVQGPLPEIGDFRFDETTGRVTVAGRELELDRNCRSILAVLLREAGTPVEKERLLHAGWPGRLVHENSLAKAISRLRAALAGTGVRIVAVYGTGYRLEFDPAALPEGVPDAPEASRPISRKRLTIALSILATVGLGTALLSGAMPIFGAGTPIREEPPKIGDAPDSIGLMLWVDDHPENNALEKKHFEDRRIAVHPVTGTEDALRLLAMYDYRLVVSDMGRGEDRLAGLRLAEQMRARGDRTPLYIYTVRVDGLAEQKAQREMVLQAGAQGVRVTPREIRDTVLAAFGNPSPR
jgi:DNA-binding response OmpR family regulator